MFKSWLLKISLAVIVILLIISSIYGFFWFQNNNEITALNTTFATETKIRDILGADSFGALAVVEQNTTLDLATLNFQQKEKKKLQGYIDLQRKLNREGYNKVAAQNKIAYTLEQDLLTTHTRLKVQPPQLPTELFPQEAFNPVDDSFIVTVETAQDLIQNQQKLTEINQKLQANLQTFIEAKKQKGEFVNPLWLETDAALEARIKTMSVEDKAGQLLMFAAVGTRMDQANENAMKSLKPGGVILMGYNVSGQTQVQSFTKGFQKTNDQIPLLIAVDQEGGEVARLTWDPTPGQTNWANTPNQTICDQAKTRAQVLKDAGFNTNFAPVVDLSNLNKTAFINNRTISPNPSTVTEKAQQFVKCQQENGVFTTLKHYPGHGATTEDSHHVLPIISKSKEDWLKTDAIPFQQIKDTKLIMVGHLVLQTVDDKPATQSPKLINEVLRKEFGYSGVLVTDAMGQLHESTKISVRDALKNSYNAGIDVVLYVSLPYGKSEQDIKNELVDLIQKGEVSQETVDQALLRILKLKREIV
jgi:beta-N-acetylhexosaminidase